MDGADILIIGAGAAGLMAAYALAKKGKKVIVLEARDRIGGRIHTLINGSDIIELGAEFVHGDLPVTLNLLNEANIPYRSASAEMWQYKDDMFSNNEQFIEHWDIFIKRLNVLQEDISIYEFLQQEFTGERYHSLRNSVERYVAGYDTADPGKASAFALRNEWQHEDEDAQHRIEGGYLALLNYLAKGFIANGGQLNLNTIVNYIYWQEGSVKAVSDTVVSFQADHLIIALPLGVLQADACIKGAVIFDPPIPNQLSALKDIGFGAIIKILLEFDEPFWENKITEDMAGKSLKEMGFILSEEEIPTWWTQMPDRSAVLTGWLGGPSAKDKINSSDEEILQQGLESLVNIFKIDRVELESKLISSHILNWTADPFTRGSYAYDTVAAPKAREILNEGISHTIYFAGEYLYNGPAMGTVEAALTSGMLVANQVCKKYSHD